MNNQNGTWIKTHTLKSLNLEIYQFSTEDYEIENNYFLTTKQLRKSLFRIKNTEFYLFLDELIGWIFLDYIDKKYHENIYNFLIKHHLI